MRPGALPALGAACSAILSAQFPSQDRGLQTWSLQQGRVTAGEGASAAPLAAGSLQKPFVAKAWAATHPGAATPRFTCGPGSACWRPGGHGELGLARALAVSCNAYFRALAAATPPVALAKTFAEEGFQGSPTTPDLAVGLAEPEGAITITPGELVEAYGRLVREPWSIGEPVRREVLAGLREAARSGTAGALGQRGWWAKTGTVPAAAGDATRTAGLLVAVDDAGFVLLGKLEPGTGREAAAALAPLLARLRPWQVLRPGVAPPAGHPRAVPPPRRAAGEVDTVRVRLLDLLGSRHIEVANLGAFPIPAGRGYLGPGASRALHPGDRVGPGLLELRAPDLGFIRRLEGRLAAGRTPRGALSLTAVLTRREYVSGVLAAELPRGSSARRIELGAAVLRFLATGPRHANADVCDSTHCAWFTGRGPRLAWLTPRRATVGEAATTDPFNGLPDADWSAILAAAPMAGPALWTAHCGGAPLSSHALWGAGDTAAAPCPRHAAGQARSWLRDWPEAAAARAFGGPVRALSVAWRDGQWTLRVEGEGGARLLDYDEAHRRLAAALGWDALPSPADAVEAVPGGWRARGVGWGHRVGLCLGD